MQIISTVAALLFSLTLSSVAFASILDPTDMRGLRNSAGGSTILLDFSAVKGGTEDQTIAHFDITGVGSFTSATLSLSMQNQDSFSSALDVYAFAGDGTVSTDEWDTGTLQEEITGLLGSPVVTTLDITSLLNTAVLNGDNFLSFNLRNEDNEGRFFLSHTINGAYGTISSAGPTFIDIQTAAVPLPSTGLLLVIGLGAFTALRRRRK